MGRLKLIKQPTQFDKIILPDTSVLEESGEKLFTKEYRETIDCVRNFALKNRTPTSSKKIYYFYGKNSFGEERLAEYFKSKGYDIIRPEKLTLDEQLNLLINCESFASTIGSASHNSIFLRDGVEVILIPRSARDVNNSFYNGFQLALNQVWEQNINYVDSSFSVFDKDHNSFCYVISKQLKNFFGDKFDGYEEDDFKTFLDYVKFSIKKGLSFNPREIEGYGVFLQDFMAQLKKRKDLIASYDMPPKWEQLRPLLNYVTHVGMKSWGWWISEDQISNPLDQKCDIQAIKMNFPDHKIFYSVYYSDAEGWSEEVISPEMAGTTGQSKSIYGIKIWFDEAGAKKFDILYRVHKYDDTWTPWAKNGEIIYSHGVKLNAIQIKLESKT